MRFKVYRFNNEDDKAHYENYEFEPKKGMSILSALFHIQNKLDDSLSFRFSCRGAVCGNCAMLINKVPRLACRTQISILIEGTDEIKLKPFPALENNIEWDPGEEILIEPLPHLPVLKDLVVDMDRFFHYYRAIEPVFKPDGESPEVERFMEHDKVTELEKYTNCILCATCVGSCPINSKNEEYIGPAALAKLYRFHIDPREPAVDSRLQLANFNNGWWGCEFHTNCKRVCPKDVPPNIAIGSARQALKASGKVPDEFQDEK
jgi:succinate dehydrogenase / fumarate reductase iron-sulfur subunit